MLRRSLLSLAAGAKTLTAEVNPRIPFAFHEVEGKPLPPMPKEVSFPAEKPMQWFRYMTVCRRMEQNSDISYKERLIRGFLHLYSGQEAIPAGMSSYLKEGDTVSTTYRCHAWYVWARGRKDLEHGLSTGPQEVFAEMYGKGADVAASRTKGGSMHLYDPDNGFHGGAGIVGAGTATGAGEALAFKYKGQKNIALTLYGDGAANQGQLAEVMNMSALWGLPCLFACENNHYGMGTAIARASANTEFHTRGGVIPGMRIDGNNLFAVMAAMEVAREFMLGGKTMQPLVFSLDTYRYSGHSMSDPGLAYRTPDEVKKMRAERDPITFLQNWMIENKVATEEQLKKVTKECNRLVDDQMDKARELSDPDESELYRDVMLQPGKYDYHVKTCQGTVYYPTADR